MLRKLLGKDSDYLSAAEEVAIERLAAMHRRLITDGGRVNTKSEAGYQACAMFLDGLEATARAMRLDPAPRAYRVAFTINYRALFPDEARNYRVDVLEASVEQYAVIWVNGDKFEFSAEAMRRAEALQRTWSEMAQLLERWNQAAEQRRTASRPSRNELRGTLVALDWAWASFEHKYIVELIEIEEKARRLIVQAIEHERCLQLLQGQAADATPATHDFKEERKRLVQCIARLNSVANFRRKGRDDLGVDVLDDATMALRRCDEAEDGGESSEAISAARILATDVIESFVSMCDYLKEVERCLERVDPHLCNNAGLVSRLVDWEESWEVASRYVQHEKLLSAVCDLVAELRAAQRVAPAMSNMVEECDVEVFMMIPRIVWLRFAAAPSKHMALLHSMLPHRFLETDSSGNDAEKQVQVDVELTVFLDKFKHAKELLVGAQPVGAVGVPSAAAAETAAWEILVRRVVAGAEGREEVYARLAPSMREGAQAAVEDLMLECEKWSIELARHCPEDWNQCTSILMRCLSGRSSGEGSKARGQAFRV